MFNLHDRSGHNKTIVAVANKLARVVFAVLSSGNDYVENIERWKISRTILLQIEINQNKEGKQEMKFTHHFL